MTRSVLIGVFLAMFAASQSMEAADILGSFGCWGRRIEDPTELVPALVEAHRATLEGKTAILNVVLGQ